MRIQTWSFALQIQPSGHHFVTVTQSLYAPNGRQIPRNLLTSDVPLWTDVTRLLELYQEATRPIYDGAGSQLELPYL